MKLLALALVALSLPAQIRQPAQNIRFGSSLPATCTANIGQVFFLTSASAGANVYGCTATNTWTVQGGSATIGGSIATGQICYASASNTCAGSAGLTFGTTANVTTLTVKAGAGQSATNLQEWQNAAGTVLMSFGSSGLLFADNTYDIGASGANRPRFVYAANAMVAGNFITGSGSGYFSVTGKSRLSSSADGLFEMVDSLGTSFSRLNLGPASSSFPSLKRSTTGLIVRLADDSADTWVKTLYVQTNVVAVASLPACNPGLEGSHYGVNDALAPTALATVVGGGAVHVSVYCDGTNWIVN